MSIPKIGHFIFVRWCIVTNWTIPNHSRYILSFILDINVSTFKILFWLKVKNLNMPRAWTNLYSTQPSLDSVFDHSPITWAGNVLLVTNISHFFSAPRNLIPTKTLRDTVILWQAVVCSAAKFGFYQEPFDKRIHKSKCVCVGESKVNPRDYLGSSSPNFIHWI